LTPIGLPPKVQDLQSMPGPVPGSILMFSLQNAFDTQ